MSIAGKGLEYENGYSRHIDKRSGRHEVLLLLPPAWRDILELGDGVRLTLAVRRSTGRRASTGGGLCAALGAGTLGGFIVSHGTSNVIIVLPPDDFTEKSPRLIMSMPRIIFLQSFETHLSEQSISPETLIPPPRITQTLLH